MKNDSTPAAPVATVDAQHPWLGLVSFTEDTRGFFHGREEEAAELGRRVQRKLLTAASAAAPPRTEPSPS